MISARDIVHKFKLLPSRRNDKRTKILVYQFAMPFRLNFINQYILISCSKIAAATLLYSTFILI